MQCAIGAISMDSVRNGDIPQMRRKMLAAGGALNRNYAGCPLFPFRDCFVLPPDTSAGVSVTRGLRVDMAAEYSWRKYRPGNGILQLIHAGIVLEVNPDVSLQ